MSSTLIYYIVLTYLQFSKYNFLILMILFHEISLFQFQIVRSLKLILPFNLMYLIWFTPDWISSKIFIKNLPKFFLYLQRFLAFILIHQITNCIINLLNLLQLLMHDLYCRLINLLLQFFSTNSILCIRWWLIRTRLPNVIRFFFLPSILLINLLS